jgi:hypothetical protein
MQKVFIDSSKSSYFRAESDNHFHYKLTRGLRVTAVSLQQLVMDNLIANITPYNNIFKYIYSGTTYTVTIPQNHYTLDQLIDQLNELINAASAGLSLTHTDKYNRL